MSHLIQVGAGSGGMPVLDMLVRDPRITHVTLIEPDVYKPHNVERHLFPPSAIGEYKAEFAKRWLTERRDDLKVDLLVCDLRDPKFAPQIDAAMKSADLGVCAADNEPTKFHWDRLMRANKIPWTLGEVLSGGIGGFVHWFRPGGPCYGCVAGHLQRNVTVDNSPPPDYSQPAGEVEETRIPASMASIHVIASLHAQLTLKLMDDPQQFDPGFTCMLMTLQQVPDVFDEAYRPHRFSISRVPTCLICQVQEELPSGEDLDVALDQALARLGDT